MKKTIRFLTVLSVLLGLAFAVSTTSLAFARDDRAIQSVAIAALPVEAKHTLALIRQGGPFPYRRDGVVFQNRERRLPLKQNGYYREYTVPTPGLSTRGARRIVAGAVEEYYYSDDHYRSFKRILNNVPRSMTSEKKP